MHIMENMYHPSKVLLVAYGWKFLLIKLSLLKMDEGQDSTDVNDVCKAFQQRCFTRSLQVPASACYQKKCLGTWFRNIVE